MKKTVYSRVFLCFLGDYRLIVTLSEEYEIMWRSASLLLPTTLDEFDGRPVLNFCRRPKLVTFLFYFCLAEEFLYAVMIKG